MNKRMDKLANIWANKRSEINGVIFYTFAENALEVFSQKIVEETLTQVAERAYYTGDRDWSDEIDRPWVQLEFGYGTLYDASHKN